MLIYRPGNGSVLVKEFLILVAFLTQNIHCQFDSRHFSKDKVNLHIFFFFVFILLTIY